MHDRKVKQKNFHCLGIVQTQQTSFFGDFNLILTLLSKSTYFESLVSLISNRIFIAINCWLSDLTEAC